MTQDELITLYSEVAKLRKLHGWPQNQKDLVEALLIAIQDEVNAMEDTEAGEEINEDNCIKL